MYEVDVATWKMVLVRMTKKYDAEVAASANMKEALLKAEALHIKEVAKVTNREKALAKVEVAYVEMVVKLSGNDQLLDKLQVELARPKSSWKWAFTQVEATKVAHGRRDPAGDLALELKD